MKIQFIAILFFFNVVERKADHQGQVLPLGGNANHEETASVAPNILVATQPAHNNEVQTFPATESIPYVDNAPDNGESNTYIEDLPVEPSAAVYPNQPENIQDDSSVDYERPTVYEPSNPYPNQPNDDAYLNTPATPIPYDTTAPPNPHDSPAPSNPYDTPAQPNPYDTPAPPNPYNTPAPNPYQPPDPYPHPSNNELEKHPIDQKFVGNVPHHPNFKWKTPNHGKYNKCFPRFEIKYKEKCETYEEKHCYTKHEEKCDTKTFQNCALVPQQNHERKCETVNEQICHLKKTYKSEQVVDYVPKQKCHKAKKRLCDTVYQFNHETRDDFLCKEITKPKCRDEWTVLYDKTCKTTFRFDCGVRGPSSGYGDWVLNPMQQVHRYKNDPYNPYNPKNPYGQENQNKHLENFKCNRIPHNRCYQTPRRVKIQKCEEVKEQKCQKVTNSNPRPVQHQNCHDEPYEECEVEKQHQTKMIQIPVFTEDCKNVPREICDNQGKTTLEVKCVDESKPVCTWKVGEEKCNNVPREHCYQVPYQEQTTDCNESYHHQTGGDGQYPGDYGSHPGPYGRPSPYGHPSAGGNGGYGRGMGWMVGK